MMIFVQTAFWLCLFSGLHKRAILSGITILITGVLLVETIKTTILKK